ncbi:MAG: N-methyl-L-tryptophan oxidase [Cyclobacteriaceae bacterium]|nr:N-methyl-L-tryptophan oxidase [Cyclobacteriaceae bacterium]
MNHFPVIVLGVGSMGSAACYYLAKKGIKVLGLEQFTLTHEFGSHAGQSRIIRKAYFEHSDYVPLLERAYQNWKALETVCHNQFYFPTGLLYAGKPESILIKGVIESSELYGVEVSRISKAEVKSRFQQFALPDDYEVLFEPDAGLLTPERCIRAFAEQALNLGASIHTHEKVVSWKQEGDRISVTTDTQTYSCNKLIITAGAWANDFLPGLANNLHVTRQVLVWTTPRLPAQFQLNKFPCWLIDDHEHAGMYYGFPMLDETTFGKPAGLKSAHHYPGKSTTANQVNREVTNMEVDELTTAITRFVPESCESVNQTKTCLYTNTPDENFIIDFLPNQQDVIIACGFSGHGFKFASVVGEVLCDLATEGRTTQPIGFLSATRFKN